MKTYGPINYNCRECHGRGVVECNCCSNETDCDACEGTGYDAVKINIEEYIAAEKAMWQAYRAAAKQTDKKQGSWELRENGVRLGRQYGDFGQVRVTDFLFKVEA